MIHTTLSLRATSENKHISATNLTAATYYSLGAPRNMKTDRLICIDRGGLHAQLLISALIA